MTNLPDLIHEAGPVLEVYGAGERLLRVARWVWRRLFTGPGRHRRPRR